MTIQTIDDKSAWNDFVAKNTTDTFLQSWEWGEFNKALDNKIWRLGVYEKNVPITVCLVVKINARRGVFLFVPHGPVVKSNSKYKKLNIIEHVKNHLQALAKDERCSFIRIAPIFRRNQENERIFNNLRFMNAPMHMHSEICWVLDLHPPEEELLANMRKTTRYLIRKSKQYNIKIKKSRSVNDLKRFLTLYNQTQQRQGFVPFGKDYLKKEFCVFSKSGGAHLYFATAPDGSESVAFIITSGLSGFYHHGAAALKDSKMPLSYALQWEIIRDLKARGFLHYNFWGIAPEEKPNHPWQGLTLFKKGFGGGTVEFVRTKDYITSPVYAINWIIETGRRLKREY